MCGKFSANYSWREIVDFSQPLDSKPGDSVTFTPMAMLPVIVWDREEQRRKVVHPADVKDVLKTMEGVDWNIAPEVKTPKKPKQKAPPKGDEDGQNLA